MDGKRETVRERERWTKKEKERNLNSAAGGATAAVAGGLAVVAKGVGLAVAGGMPTVAGGAGLGWVRF